MESQRLLGVRLRNPLLHLAKHLAIDHLAVGPLAAVHLAIVHLGLVFKDIDSGACVDGINGAIWLVWHNVCGAIWLVWHNVWLVAAAGSSGIVIGVGEHYHIDKWR